jgi:SpoVK/Ycf46/Vps4 family AAA+-type ATPase
MSPTSSLKRKRNTPTVTISEFFKSSNDEPIIETIQDLINYFIKLTEPTPAPTKRRRKVVVATQATPKNIKSVINSLQKLQDMVGLKDVKQMILSQLLYFLHGLNDGKLDMLHTVIQGPPGVGKTKLACILGEIYASIGVLQSNRFVIARRSDLVGKFLGHTADKTQSVIDSCRGGVLLIDEAYSLGHTGDNQDSFSKECLDTLNQNLTENREGFMCIIAGYEKALQDCFFSVNEGLTRRFSFRYSMKPYKSEELYAIFNQMITTDGWILETDTIKNGMSQTFFDKHASAFPHSAGDLETLYLHVKLAHARSLTSNKSNTQPRYITMIDIEKGFQAYLQVRQENTIAKGPPIHMYL